jgi:DNA-binding beta-propeller fold protein YncE
MELRSLAIALLLTVPHGCGDASTPDAPGRLDHDALLGEPGRSPGQFLYPRAMDADEEGLWIADKSARVQRLDPSTGAPIAGFTMPDTAQGMPTGLTLAPSPLNPRRRALWVPDTHYHRVLVYDTADIGPGSEPTPVARFGAYGTGPGQFIYLTDVAVLTAPGGALERIYVTEYGGNDRVSVFDASFEFLFSFGRFGVDDDAQGVRFNRPQSIEIDPARRELVVADACNHRIGRFTLDGRLIAWIGSPTEDTFSYPYGLRLLEGSRALVAEFGGNRLALVNLGTGTVIERLGMPGRNPGELASPWAVAASGRRAYVLDSGNNRVQVFTLPAQALPRYPDPGATATRSGP